MFATGEYFFSAYLINFVQFDVRLILEKIKKRINIIFSWRRPPLKQLKLLKMKLSTCQTIDIIVVVDTDLPSHLFYNYHFR